MLDSPKLEIGQLSSGAAPRSGRPGAALGEAPTLAGALERRLLEEGGSAAASGRHRLGMLEDGLAAVLKEEQAMDVGQSVALAQLQERVEALETAANATAPPRAGVGAKPAGNVPVNTQVPAEPGEGLVYGVPATAVIVRWRVARDAVGECKDALDRLNARERVLELEVELIHEHQFTLPSPAYPWDWGDRRQEVRRRTQYLDGLRAARNRLKLHRFITFGLWRN